MQGEKQRVEGYWPSTVGKKGSSRVGQNRTKIPGIQFWSSLIPSLSKSLLIHGAKVMLIKEGRVELWKNTWHNAQYSTLFQSCHLYPFIWESGPLQVGKTALSIVTLLCRIHWFSRITSHTLLFYYSVILENESCVLQYSQHCQHVSVPLQYTNICWKHDFLVNKLFQPTKLNDSDIVLWSHSFFSSSSTCPTKKEKTLQTQQWQWILNFSCSPRLDSRRLLSSQFQ